MAASSLKDDKGVLPEHVDPTYSPTRDSHDIVNVQGGDLLDLESVDPVLNAKMKMVNDAIDEIGFTRYQAKLFVLNGFGYVHVYFCRGGQSGSITCAGSQHRMLRHLLQQSSRLVVLSHSRPSCVARRICLKSYSSLTASQLRSRLSDPAPPVHRCHLCGL